MTTERLFKVLNVDGSSCHGGSLQWGLPKGRPGRWHQVSGELIPCENGLHLCREKDLLDWLGPAIFLAEARGERIEETDKVVVREARLVRRIDTWNDRTARLFAVACARRALERERVAGREPASASWAALEEAANFAEGHSSADKLAAARAAARDAASAAASAAEKAAERQWQTAELMRVLLPGDQE